MTYGWTDRGAKYHEVDVRDGVVHAECGAFVRDEDNPTVETSESEPGRTVLKDRCAACFDGGTVYSMAMAAADDNRKTGGADKRRRRAESDGGARPAADDGGGGRPAPFDDAALTSTHRSVAEEAVNGAGFETETRPSKSRPVVLSTPSRTAHYTPAEARAASDFVQHRLNGAVAAEVVASLRKAAAETEAEP